MKYILALALISFMVFPIESLLACSPPRDGFDLVTFEIAAVVQSHKVVDKFRELGAKTIENLWVKDGFYFLRANNKCIIKTTTRYAPPESIGQCPKLSDIIIVSDLCPSR